MALGPKQDCTLVIYNAVLHMLESGSNAAEYLIRGVGVLDVGLNNTYQNISKANIEPTPTPTATPRMTRGSS